MAKRLAGRCGYPADNPFTVTLHKDKLSEPLRWKKPRRVFVNSMSDLFHENISDEFICDMFRTMSYAHEHTFMILTKRPERAKVWYDRHSNGVTIGRDAFLQPIYCEWPLPNVWIGVTAENQHRADERIPILLQIPSAVRFVSVEPMLGSVDLNKSCESEELDWVICGGETGPGARPMHPDWVRSLRDQCHEAKVPFFFKSWGEWFPRDEWEYNPELVLPDDDVAYHDGQYTKVFDSWDGPCPVHKVGKKKAGRLLDGQEWNEIPDLRRW
jgi:protein gp37